MLCYKVCVISKELDLTIGAPLLESYQVDAFKLVMVYKQKKKDQSNKDEKLLDII